MTLTFLQAVQGNTRHYYWTGRITTAAGAVYGFTQEDIVKGSGYVSGQCCGSSEIELGTVYAVEMGISLYLPVDRYTLEDAQVELFYHLRLADGSYEEVPMGIFEVSEANRTAHFLELKAYDYMLRFERDFNGFESVGTAYGFMELCAKACKVNLAQTEAEIGAMPNGSEVLSIYVENDIETYRDVLYFVAQVLGGFFCINRAGKLELRKYGDSPVAEVLQRHRFSSSFSDFVTRYTAVSSTNLRTQTAEYYAADPDDGLTMNLGVNPLLQFGLDEAREALCRNILASLSAVNYVPFDSETIGNPAFDLGDVLTFSGGQADGERLTCITSFHCKIGGKMKLKCVGKNPRLAQANRAEIMEAYREVMEALTDTADLDAEQERLQNEGEVVMGLIRKVISDNAQKAMDQAEYERKYNGYCERYEAARVRLVEIGELRLGRIAKRTKISLFLKELASREGLVAEFDEELWYATVDHVAVYEDKRMVFTFRDHTQVEIPADRWKAA